MVCGSRALEINTYSIVNSHVLNVDVAYSITFTPPAFYFPSDEQLSFKLEEKIMRIMRIQPIPIE